MIHFTPEQYAVFVGGVRCIKKVIKKKRKGRSTRNRKQKKGTRRRQKGGNKVLRTIINGLFLAALFSAYLINTGTDMSLQTGIMAFSDASNLGVNADDVNNFMEGLAILIFYSGVNWEVGGQSRPSTCDQGQWTPNVPGFGKITSLTSDPVPGWSADCPRNAHIIGTVLSSVLAGMFMAWVGPCIISELVDSIMGPLPADPTPAITSADPTPAITSPDPTPAITSADQQPSSTGERGAAAFLAQELNKITVNKHDRLLQRPGRKFLTPGAQQEMARRSDRRRQRCKFSNPPFPSDTEAVRGQQLTTTNIQGEQLGNTLISLPREVMLQLKQSGKLKDITDMILEASTNIGNSASANQWVDEIGADILELDPNGRLQLKDTWRDLDLCQIPLPSGSCPPISESTKQKALADRVDSEAREQEAQLQVTLKKNREMYGPPRGPAVANDGAEEEETGLKNSWLRTGGAKRKQSRRRRKRNKKTKKKRPRNKKKSRKRR